MVLVYSLGGSILADRDSQSPKEYADALTSCSFLKNTKSSQQSEALDKILLGIGQKIDVVLNIDVPDQELIKRMTGRRMRKC